MYRRDDPAVTPCGAVDGTNAAPLPEAEDFSCYDLVISSLPNVVEHFRRMGVPAEPHRLAFEPRVLQGLKGGEPKTPITFVGSVDSYHDGRVRLLESLCRSTDRKIYGPELTVCRKTR